MSSQTRLVACVFGGHRTPETDIHYQEAALVSRYLAERNVHVRCGGYSGIMEATARGTRAGGGECEGIGLSSSDEIPNSFIAPAGFRAASDIYRRLEEQIGGVSLFIIFPGGVGTLAELSTLWAARILGEVPTDVQIVLI
ncbi:MAG: hypothetical protein ACREA0_13015, partial [bacterium]